MSEYDLKIRGGTLVDGTGRERYRGDVALRDGRIVAVGDCPGKAARELDAEGALVTPGFTDLHTHYDGQVSWDADLAPSCLHGVTTAVVGNCGVGFAPVRPTDHVRLIELMEGVEDIPGSALHEGISWRWESFPQYLDAIDGFPHAIDFAAYVPHDPLRMYVMGERAVAGSPATEEDIARMRQLLREALEAGAVGFSTGRSDNHRTSRGAATPASESSVQELVGLAQAFHGLGHGVLQVVSDFDIAQGPERFDAEFDVVERLAAAADGHALSMSLMQRDQDSDQWRRILERTERAHARGLPLRVQVAPRGIGVMIGLDATFHPLVGHPSYRAIAHLPLAERVRRLREPALRAQLLQEKPGKVSGEGSAVPPLVDFFLQNLEFVSARLYRLGERPDYEPTPDDSLLMVAEREGRPVMEVIYDALLEQEGRALLYFPVFNYTEMSLDTVHTMLTHPLALPGLSDGGAHVGTVCDASFPTFLLTHWGRDRPRGRLPLEQLVRMQAHDTARFLGLADRGLIAPGQKADLNVIDWERLRLLHPEMHADLPAGGKRLLQRADGYRYTLVSGEVIAQEGRLTGRRPGRLVRAPR